MGPGVLYIGHCLWCFGSWCPIYWTSGDNHILNFINIQIPLTLKITIISFKMLYIHLEFEDEFKYFVNVGPNTLYNKTKRKSCAKMCKCDNNLHMIMIIKIGGHMYNIFHILSAITLWYSVPYKTRSHLIQAAIGSNQCMRCLGGVNVK